MIVARHIGRLAAACAAALLLAAAAAHAQQQPPRTIQVVEFWARASSGPTAAAYLTLRNHGDADDRLVAVSSAAAERAVLHGMKMDGDIMRMRPVEAIEVKAHGTTELKPGGMHVMLVGLKAPLKAGQSIPLVLRFERAGEMVLQASVAPVGATGPAGTEMPHEHHGP